MSDLETYLFDVCKGKSEMVLAEGGSADTWNREITVGATERIVILNILLIFREDYFSVTATDASLSLAFSVETGQAAIDADSNKIHLLDDIDCSVQNAIHPKFLDFEGCPVVGGVGQHVFVMVRTAAAADKPLAHIQFLRIT